MRVATWNVNSIRSRLEHLTGWIDRRSPDLVCVQETKTVDEAFPREPLEKRGYHVEVFGEKTYNGVALLSRAPLTQVQYGLPAEGSDASKRVIAARVGDISVINVYVPNGSRVGSDRFVFKLEWLERLRVWLEQAWDPSLPLLVCGDFNIAPEDIDVHDPDAWRGQVLFHPDEHAALARILDWGLEDVLRRHHRQKGFYTWWDYRAGAFRRDHGLRIDLILATAPLAERCTDVLVDREERSRPRPSDHAPVLAAFR